MIPDTHLDDTGTDSDVPDLNLTEYTAATDDGYPALFHNCGNDDGGTLIGFYRAETLTALINMARLHHRDHHSSFDGLDAAVQQLRATGIDVAPDGGGAAEEHLRIPIPGIGTGRLCFLVGWIRHEVGASEWSITVLRDGADEDHLAIVDDLDTLAQKVTAYLNQATAEKVPPQWQRRITMATDTGTIPPTVTATCDHCSHQLTKRIGYGISAETVQTDLSRSHECAGVETHVAQLIRLATTDTNDHPEPVALDDPEMRPH